MSKEKKREEGAPRAPRKTMVRLQTRHRRFLTEYLKDLNATQAAIRAGYKPRNADAHGYLLLRRPDIAAALEQRLETRRIMMRHIADRVVSEYINMALSDPRHVADWDANSMTLRPKESLSDADAAAIAEIVPQGSSGKGAKVRLYDKKAALDALARHLGLFDGWHSLGEDKTVAAKQAKASLRDRLERHLQSKKQLDEEK